jgi:Fibronectin type III domain
MGRHRRIGGRYRHLGAADETLAIGVTSSAFDEVPSIGCTVAVDERGDARPGAKGQTACDAGAYQYQGTAPKPPAAHAPSAPRSPHAKAGKRLITVSWSAPSSTGAAAISAYVASCSTNKHPSATNGKSAKTTAKKRSAEVKALKAGKKYYCDVVARNSAGTSHASSVVSAKPKK